MKKKLLSFVKKALWFVITTLVLVRGFQCYLFDLDGFWITMAWIAICFGTYAELTSDKNREKVERMVINDDKCNSSKSSNGKAWYEN